MSIEVVRQCFVQHGMADKIMEFDTSSATVELAGQAVGVIPARIAKTLSFKNKDGNGLLIVTAGDTKIDNGKFKGIFHTKAKMLTPEEALALTGHMIGAVCPFGISKDVPVYLDVSLKRFQTVFPACGSSNSAIALDCEQLFTLSNALEWIDVCKDWDTDLS
jgi:prolyl-tRNA editing enzyme YbaK/EbsC (Cys-tRNA(Pro) deacylase)